MKKDIQNRADIELLVNTFYDKIKNDPAIWYIFTDVSKIDWEKHLPNMYDFWDNILFYSGSYKGSPMNLHTHLNKITTLKKKHFNRWTGLFTSTVDELFSGKNADLIKQRALGISAIMQQNLFHQP